MATQPGQGRTNDPTSGAQETQLLSIDTASHGDYGARQCEVFVVLFVLE